VGPAKVVVHEVQADRVGVVSRRSSRRHPRCRSSGRASSGLAARSPGCARPTLPPTWRPRVAGPSGRTGSRNGKASASRSRPTTPFPRRVPAPRRRTAAARGGRTGARAARAVSCRGAGPRRATPPRGLVSRTGLRIATQRDVRDGLSYVFRRRERERERDRGTTARTDYGVRSPELAEGAQPSKLVMRVRFPSPAQRHSSGFSLR
jgi:hypothetical protein